ncbi:hypothetical protein DID80_02055 [Candidatus Marinamargulisbacteria bacterium SCGC AAA071-K20]|nr:hypothetical protein DID80_02055 [Candidatus Marinamargulisbacteria bacterium SCGC AAA071-K20]
MIKQLILLTLFLLYLPTSLFSNEIEAILNSNYAVKFGVNSGTVDYQYASSQLSLFLALSGTYEYTPWWHSIGELKLSQRKFHVSDETNIYDVENTYLQIPVMLRFSKYNTNDKTRAGFLVGAYAEYLLKTSQDDLFKGDVGGILGLQYEWTLKNDKRLFLEYKYEIGLKQFKTFGRNKNASLGLGYDF